MSKFLIKLEWSKRTSSANHSKGFTQALSIRESKILNFIPTFAAQPPIKRFELFFSRQDFRILGSSNTAVQISATFPCLTHPSRRGKHFTSDTKPQIACHDRRLSDVVNEIESGSCRQVRLFMQTSKESNMQISQIFEIKMVQILDKKCSFTKILSQFWTNNKKKSVFLKATTKNKFTSNFLILLGHSGWQKHRNLPIGER